MADFDTAIHHDAGFAAAWSNRGLCHLDRYEDMQAAVDFTRALELGGEQAVTLFHRAAAYARLKRHAEAEADLTRAADYAPVERSEEHTSDLQSLMRTSYAVFCLNTTHINIY